MHRLKKFAKELRTASGLVLDPETNEVYGEYNGYMAVLRPFRKDVAAYTVSFSLDGYDGAPREKEMKQLARSCPALSGCSVEGHKVVFGFKGAATAGEYMDFIIAGLDDVTEALRVHGYRNCCENCGEDKGIGVYRMEDREVRLLCEDCYQALRAKTSKKESRRKQKKIKEVRENIAGGIAGALLGAVIGAAVITITEQMGMGYASVISGLVLAVCTLKGYELLGEKLSRKGIFFSVILMIAASLAAKAASRGFSLYREADGAVGILDCIRRAPYVILENPELRLPFLKELGFLYLFMILGAVPVIFIALRKNRAPLRTGKLI